MADEVEHDVGLALAKRASLKISLCKSLGIDPVANAGGRIVCDQVASLPDAREELNIASGKQ
jgi:hypothetical protein